MKKLLKFIKYNLFPYLFAIPTFLKGNECQKYSDCVLLHKMLIKAPRYYDRAIEYPWVLKNVDLKKGNFLDVGSTVGKLFRKHLPKDVRVFAINTEKEQRFSQSENIQHVVGDIRKTEFKDSFFDVITCVSTLEHIGVEGRYNIKKDLSGDKKAMIEMHRILKKGGKLLVTTPYGKKDVLPLNKLYNKERLVKLFKGFKVISACYMKYDSDFYIWTEVTEKQAASTDWENERWYSIGFFILQKI